MERRDARKACSRGIPEPVTADVAKSGTVRCLCRPSGASMLCAAPMRLPAISCASADACRKRRDTKLAMMHCFTYAWVELYRLLGFWQLTEDKA